MMSSGLEASCFSYSTERRPIICRVGTAPWSCSPRLWPARWCRGNPANSVQVSVPEVSGSGIACHYGHSNGSACKAWTMILDDANRTQGTLGAPSTNVLEQGGDAAPDRGREPGCQ